MATRHYCTIGATPRCPYGNGSPGKGPKSGRCSECHGLLTVTEGVYGVFVHSSISGSARYSADEAEAIYQTEAAAERYRVREDPADARLVVRFVIECPPPPPLL